MAKEFTMAEMEDKSLIQKSLPINKGIFVVFNHWKLFWSFNNLGLKAFQNLRKEWKTILYWKWVSYSTVSIFHLQTKFQIRTFPAALDPKERQPASVPSEVVNASKQFGKQNNWNTNYLSLWRFTCDRNSHLFCSDMDRSGISLWILLQAFI